MINEVTLEMEREKHNKICIFGTGRIGTGSGYQYVEILQQNGFVLDCYCDNNNEKWGKEIRDGVKCISPEELYTKDDILVLVMVSYDKQPEIIDQLKKVGKDYYTYSELATSDFFVDFFLEKQGGISDKTTEKQCIGIQDIFTVKNYDHKKIAVYTCICGDYDYVRIPEVTEDECDYYLITDNPIECNDVWKIIDIKKIVPSFVNDNYRKNRFCKILGCEIFREYEKSIYIDGNMLIKGPISHYVEKIGKCGIALFEFPHEGGDCLYLHGLQVAGTRAPINEVRKQLYRYKQEEMPRHYGLFECNFIARENKNPVCRKIMQDWWKEVYMRTYRDQISFMYVVWKNGFSADDIGHLGENVRKVDEIERTVHYYNEKR